MPSYFWTNFVFEADTYYTILREEKFIIKRHKNSSKKFQRSPQVHVLGISEKVSKKFLEKFFEKSHIKLIENF